MGENTKRQDKETIDGIIEPIESTTENSVAPPSDTLSDEEYSAKVARVRKTVLIAAGIVALLIVVTLGIGLWNDLYVIPNQVIATVDDQEITVDTYQTRARYFRFQLLQESVRVQQILEDFGDYDGNQQAYYGQLQALLNTPSLLSGSVMNSLLEDIVLHRKAEEMGIVITEEDVDAAFYEKLKESAENPAGYTDEEYAVDYAEFMEKKSTADLTEADVREMRRNILIRDAVMKVITADIPSEKSSTIEEVWARHILMENEIQANQVANQVRYGYSSFWQAARKNSIDDGTSWNSGDLGWFGRGFMVKEFEDAVFSMEIGEICNAVETMYGYHIIELLDKRNRPLTEEEIITLKNESFKEWLLNERLLLAESMVVDQELLEQYTPEKPSLDDPKVFEALFGMAIEEYNATTNAPLEE